jgi:RNA polymerase sigma-70 factor, ECF subfamily
LAEPDLSALVARAQKGDRVAFEKLVHGTARLVYAQIVASIRDRQKAEDLLQETYVSAWRAIGSVQSPGGFVTWLLTLARNTTLDAIKFEGRKKRGGKDAATRSGLENDLPDDGLTPPENAELAEAREHALRLLDELPDEYRRPLALRYLAGADYDTICRQLHLTDGSLRGLLNRGMALLRERMTKQSPYAKK